MNMNNNIISIKVADYYQKPEYYRFMPESIFNALEQAFINGLESCNVNAAEYNKMMGAFNSEK